MRIIYKYVVDSGMVLLPSPAQILTMQSQGNNLCIWALIDSDSNMYDSYRVHKYGTGWDLTGQRGEYVTTIQDGPFVWHYFLEKL